MVSEEKLQQSEMLSSLTTTDLSCPFFIDKFGSPNPWLVVFESNFNNKATSRQKYNRLLSCLPAHLLQELSTMILESNTSDDPYAKLKESIMSNYSTNATIMFEKHFRNQDLGKRTPTQFLKQIIHDWETMQPGITDAAPTLIRKIFTNGLPKEIRAILATAATDDFEKLAVLADKIYAVLPEQDKETTVRTAIFSEEINSLTSKIEELQSEISSLRQSSSKQSKWQSGHHSFDNESAQCYFHTRFGRNAQKCRPGCRHQNMPGLQMLDICIFHDKHGDAAKSCDPSCKFSIQNKKYHSKN